MFRINNEFLRLPLASVIDAPVETPIQDPMIDELNTLWETPSFQKDEVWQIVVLDDSVNTMSHVALVFIKYFKLTPKKAIAQMMEVHTKGASILDHGKKEEMLIHHEAMGQYGLQSKVEQQ
jgi:ATP-dependent Clp protease adapter protein ClpS